MQPAINWRDRGRPQLFTRGQVCVGRLCRKIEGTMSGHFFDQDFSANVAESSGPSAGVNSDGSHSHPVPAQGKQGSNPTTHPAGGSGAEGSERHDPPPIRSIVPE